MTAREFIAPISQDIWEQKYRLKHGSDAVDQSLDDTFWRVARAAAAAERGTAPQQTQWAHTFHDAMTSLSFLPAGRILAGASSNRNVTLFNCFVLGTIGDDIGSIFDAAKEAALTMQSGGGIGHDFSTLRPRGAPVRGVAATASGPVSFMDVWDAMCRTLMSAGQRRGAMMATLQCSHPGILEFIAAKSDPTRLRNFNLSVLVTDDFIAAVKSGAPWPLVFDGQTYATIPARELWHVIARSNYDYAEPGVIFIDRVNAMNNLGYCETISATNPCGEQPLPPYGACLLGSINLAQLIDQPFTPEAALNEARLKATVAVAVRMLDNVIDISNYPLQQQRVEALEKRRIGLGVTGLADALIFLGQPYNSQAARNAAAGWMRTIQHEAYRTSAMLAAEKGAFPLYDSAKFLDRPNVRALTSEIRALIAAHGIRNGCLTSIAPAGTISLLAGNVSSGIEPVFDFRYQRRIKTQSGTRDEIVEDFAHMRFQQMNATAPQKGSGAWLTVAELTPRDHLAMQAALQPHVDSAISKTINCPQDIDQATFEHLYLEAYDLGLKGCTLFRPNAVTGSVLSQLPSELSSPPSGTPPARPAMSNRPAVQSKPSGTDGVIYLSEPLARDPILSGKTYKLKWPATDHAYYITINDTVRDGRRRPFEIFINTKDLTHFAWTVALTRMISAVFRRGGDVAFVAEELRAIFDPEGGQWVGGAYVPSLLAAIGGVIDSHLTGLELPTASQDEAAIAVSSQRPAPANRTSDPLKPAAQPQPQLCPRCSQPGFRLDGSCRICLNCGHSTCD